MHDYLSNIINYLRVQVGLKADAGSATGSLHAKLTDIISAIGTLHTSVDQELADTKFYIVPSDVQVYLDARETNHAYSTLNKAREFIVGKKGTARIKYDVKRADNGIGASAWLYLNGTEIGTEKSLTTAYVTYSQDYAVNVGDKIQLYLDGGSGVSQYIKNFGIYGNVGGEGLITH